MVETPLFYKKIVPLNREAHKGLHVDASAGRFGFARHAHMIPAVTDEFGAGSRALPIVFVPGPNQASPVFLLGLRPGENIFVADDGRWTAPYIPAYVRRYPFIIGEVSNGEPMVCIDEAAEGLRAGSGEALFQESGDDTPALANTIKFINDYLLAAKRTEAFVADLQTLGLFRSITIDLRSPHGQTKTLHGVMSVDVEKLQTLEDDKFLQLRSSGYLPLIYAHLNSLGVIETFATRSEPEPVTANASHSKGTKRRMPETATTE
jgi:hypothetical protein